MNDKFFPLKSSEKKILFLVSISFILLFTTRLINPYFSVLFSDTAVLLIHTLSEATSIFIAISIFIQAWITYTPFKKNAALFVGFIFLTIGIFDIIHTLLYKGMPFLNDDFSIARATWFWIVARMTETIGIGLAIVIPGKLFIKNRYMTFFIVILYVTIISTIIIFYPDKLPLLHIDGLGLTSFKIGLEYIICTFLLLTLVFLLKRYKRTRNNDMLRLVTGVFLILISELFFSLYLQVFDWENFLGHLFKFLGYIFLYRAIFFPQIQQLLADRDDAIQKRMEAESKLSEIEKELSRRIIQAHEEEKKHVSRELHDGVGQSIYSILVTLNLLDHDLPKEKKNEILQDLKKMTGDTMKEVKEVAYSLRPSALDDLGFIPALKSYLSSFEKTHHMAVELTISPNYSRLDGDKETALYRICQEALTNVAKYSEATVIKIELIFTENDVCLSIKDDGIGFQLDKIEQRGIGLFSMKERAEILAGTLKIDSAIGRGTEIKVCIPLGSTEKNN